MWRRSVQHCVHEVETPWLFWFLYYRHQYQWATQFCDIETKCIRDTPHILWTTKDRGSRWTEEFIIHTAAKLIKVDIKSISSTFKLEYPPQDLISSFQQNIDFVPEALHIFLTEFFGQADSALKVVSIRQAITQACRLITLISLHQIGHQFLSKFLVDTLLNSLGFSSSYKVARPNLPIGIVGHWPRAHWYLGGPLKLICRARMTQWWVWPRIRPCKEIQKFEMIVELMIQQCQNQLLLFHMELSTYLLLYFWSDQKIF